MRVCSTGGREVRTEKYPLNLVIRKSLLIFKRTVSALGEVWQRKAAWKVVPRTALFWGRGRLGVEKSMERVEVKINDFFKKVE